MLHLDASIPAALAHTRRRASLLSVSDDRARAAMNRRTGSRGGMRRGGGGVPVDAAEAAINAVSGLVVNLDARDLSAGAITHWFDRKYGYDFAGTATRNAAINGQPTVSGNGTTDILTSTAAISQISGSQAVTVVAVMQDTFVAAATGIRLTTVVVSQGRSS